MTDVMMAEDVHGSNFRMRISRVGLQAPRRYLPLEVCGGERAHSKTLVIEVRCPAFAVELFEFGFHFDVPKVALASDICTPHSEDAVAQGNSTSV